MFGSASHGTCIIFQRVLLINILIAVHGFPQVVYYMDEGDRLDTEFRLNVKGMTAFPGLNISGTITAEAAGTAGKKSLCRVLDFISLCSKL